MVKEIKTTIKVTIPRSVRKSVEASFEARSRPWYPSIFDEKNGILTINNVPASKVAGVRARLAELGCLPLTNDKEGPTATVLDITSRKPR